MRIVLAIVAIALATGAARSESVKIPQNLVEAAVKANPDCTDEKRDEPREAKNLGHGLKLVPVLCWTAAYQSAQLLYAADPKAPDKARLLRFKSWAGKKFDWVTSLTEPFYDPRTRVLSMRHKGRGMADCGVLGRWKWNGRDFKLTGFWNKPTCDDKLFTGGERWRIYPPRR